MNSSRWYLSAIAVTGALVALSACSSSKSTALTPESGAVTLAASEDAASAVATTLYSTNAGFTVAQGNGEANLTSASPFHIALAHVPPSLQRVTEQTCTLNSSGLINTFGSDTIAYVRDWQYFSGGTCTDDYVTGGTDSVQFSTVDTSYLQESGGHTHSYHQGAHYVVGDTIGGGTLLHGSADRFWSGVDSVTDTVTITHSNFTVVYDLTANDSLHNATFPNPRNNDYPIGGTFSRTVTGTATYSGGVSGQNSISRFVTVTFVPSSTVGSGATQDTVKVYSSHGGSLMVTCLVDLSSSTEPLVSNSCH